MWHSAQQCSAVMLSVPFYLLQSWMSWRSVLSPPINDFGIVSFPDLILFNITKIQLCSLFINNIFFRLFHPRSVLQSPRRLTTTKPATSLTPSKSKSTPALRRRNGFPVEFCISVTAFWRSTGVNLKQGDQIGRFFCPIGYFYNFPKKWKSQK